MTEAHKKYESTPEFQSYLAAKMRWEFRHDAYLRSSSHADYLDLIRTEQEMNGKLATARRLPIHVEAFGW